MELAAGDMRFDVPLDNACLEERTTLCADAQPGHGRIVRCLQTKCGMLRVVTWLLCLSCVRHPTSCWHGPAQLCGRGNRPHNDAFAGDNWLCPVCS